MRRTPDREPPSVERNGFRCEFLTPLDGDGGDAHITAPDGSGAGIVWRANTSWRFEEGAGPDVASGRWGVWLIDTPLPMRDAADAAEFLEAALPDLTARWRDAVAQRRAARRQQRSARQQSRRRRDT